MFDRGYLKIGRIRGIPLRVHWTMPLGALVFSGFAFAPAFWVGFFVVVVVHELGHAALVRRYRQRVLSVDITGFGGLTRWAGTTTRTERGVIAWGGVLAQAVLLLVTLLVVVVAGPPRSIITAQLVSVFTMTNLWIIGINLLPFPPLDGAHAWPLLGDLAGRWRGGGGRGSGRKRAPPRWPRSSGRRTGGASSGRTGGASSASPRRSAGSTSQGTELADALRRIGEQAGEARRGGSKR